MTHALSFLCRVGLHRWVYMAADEDRNHFRTRHCRKCGRNEWHDEENSIWLIDGPYQP